MQNTLLNAEENFVDFRGRTKSAVLAWLRQILQNEIKAAHRKYVQADKRNVRREIRVGTESKAGPIIADGSDSS